MAKHGFSFDRRKRVVSSSKIMEDDAYTFHLSKILKRELTLTLVSIFAVTIVFLGGSYSIFSQIKKADDYNILKTGTLALEFQDTEDGLGNIISLNGEYPISDGEGADKTPYTFKIKNTGTVNATYNIRIVDDNDMIDADECRDKLMDKSVIRYSIDDGEAMWLSDATDTVVKTGDILGGGSETHTIKMWISDQRADNDILGKHYHGKIIVDAQQNESAEAAAGAKSLIEKANLINSTYALASLDKKNEMYGVLHSDGTADYRYVGATPNNYITFNEDTYRIIGVFPVTNGSGKTEHRIKIVKDSSIGSYAWNANGNSKWSASTIKTLLNREGDFYKTLNEKARNQIENAKYYLGTGAQSDADSYYTLEKKAKAEESSWVGEVGLMYLSDYLFTSSLGSGSGWLSSNNWTITPSAGTDLTAKMEVRPVVYLKANVQLTGTGTVGDPYIIG